MANFKALPIAAAVATALVAMSASAVEFHGYMRAGFGANVDGGSQYCYGTGGPDWHFVGRLGDECDTYAELSLSQDVYEKNGEKFSVNTLVAYGTREGFADARGNSFQGVSLSNDGTAAEYSTPWEGQRLSFREAYAKYTMKSGAGLWAGNRFYGRKDIHIMDFYYLNNSGYGAGIENVQAGPGQFSAAFVQHKWKNPTDGSGNALEGTQVYSTANTIDLRYGNLQVGPVGALDFVLLYAHPSYTKNQEDAIKNGTGNVGDYGLDNDGFSFTTELSTPVLGGFNKAVIQYSTEGYAWAGFKSNHLGDSYNMEQGQDDRKALRLIDHGVVKFGKQVDFGYAVVYAQLDKGNGNNDDAKFYSVVLRPQFKWNDTMSTILEVGNYSQKFGSTWGAPDWDDFQKFTLAQAWSPLQNGGFWARPQLRVFASYYTGSQNYSGDIDSENDTMLGAQVEAWW